MNNKQKLLSNIPQISQVLEHSKLKHLLTKFSHDFVVSSVQEETDLLRKKITQNEEIAIKTREEILTEIVKKTVMNIQQRVQPSLKKAINATGIILHTGLGRAPLSKEAQKNILRVAEGYCNLELDLESGKRGQRTKHVEGLLCYLTGAQAACVVNNNAAAVLLTLNTLCFEKEAIISRGQLVEIGGSFRMPEVMEKSGTKMVEVGTTNKTHYQDYERAITDNTGLICVVHTSNYRVQGFTAEVSLSDLVELAHERQVVIVQDLGGGVLFDLQRYQLPNEPVVRESVSCGVDVVTFSGDKVLGGPQSGIIVGKKKYVDLIKSNPLMRALRCDKLSYAALESTLKHYLQEKDLPENNRVLKMLLEPLDNLTKRAKRLQNIVLNSAKGKCDISIEDTFVQMGSGALPLEQLPSKAISLYSDRVPTESLARRFRTHEPPIIGYIRDNRLFFDLRTIFEEEDEEFVSTFEKILSTEI